MSDSLRHIATVERPVHNDDFEDDEEEWEDVGKIRFALTAAQGTDPDTDERVDHVKRFTVRTRWRPDIAANMRLDFNGRKLNIVGIPMDVNERRKWLEFDCEELVL